MTATEIAPELSTRLDSVIVEETESFLQRQVPQSVSACYALIEREMFRGPWVMGDAYTVCDPYLFTLAQWMEDDGVDVSKLPKVLDHRRRMSERSAVRKAIADELA